MSFTTTDRKGAMEVDPTLERLDALVRELDEIEDDEHPDVAVAHESGWSLSALPSGLVVWENVEVGIDERRVNGITREQLRLLFRAVARGDSAFVETLLAEVEANQP